MKFIPLKREFYCRNTVEVAQDLLGKLLVRVIDDKLLIGTIVETEAYMDNDPACHAFNGPTQRTKVLFEESGRAYVYFIYGNYFNVNAVARAENQKSGGVLIRAVEPLVGLEYMHTLRADKPLKNLTNGPGKLAQALNIDKRHYGVDLTQIGDLYIAESLEPSNFAITASPRIGITKAQDRLWRFFIKNNPFVTPSKLNKVYNSV